MATDEPLEANIKIEGFPATGKSSMAWAIKTALASHGINCAIRGCEDEIEGEMDASWEERLSKLKGKTILITTIQLNQKQMTKNRWENLPSKSKTPQQVKGTLFLKLLEAALQGPMIDTQMGHGPLAPVEHTTTLAAMIADDVDEIFRIMEEKGFEIH